MVNQQDRSFLTVFAVIMGALALISGIIFILARLVGMTSPASDEGDPRLRLGVDERIAPVAHVVLAGSTSEASEPEAAVAEALSAEEVVAQACAACHQSGVMEAPKIGNQEDWGARAEQGIDTLVDHALNGIRSMPARGGNPNLSDDEVRSATLLMLGQSGVEVEGAEAAAEQPAADAGQQQSATEEAASEAPQAAASEGGEEVDLAKGEELYGQVCVACHAAGVANAPKLGDQAAWAPRLEKGPDGLTSSVINGLGAMPPKGGAAQLSDADIKSIVSYMISTVQ